MNWIIIENNTKINALDIPTVSIEDIKSDFGTLKLRYFFKFVDFWGYFTK